MRSKIAPAARLALVLLSAGGLAAGAQAAGTTLYKWIDADGVTHYSDRPEPGSQRVQIGAAQSYKSVPVIARQAPPAPLRREPAAMAYTRVAITSPAAGTVFANEGTAVQVSAAVEPQLAAGHQLWFMLDGQRVEGLSTSDGTAQLEVARGAHAIAVTIVDANGNELISSSAVPFAVRLPSVVNPPRGPLLPPLKPPQAAKKP